MKIKKPLLLAALAIVVVGMARELGWVSLNLYRSESTDQSSSRVRDIGERSNGWAVVVVDPGARGDNTVQAANAPANTISIVNSTDVFRGEITEFELSGPWWLPLIKSSEITYEARITRNGREVGGASGTIHMRVKGLCSAYEFRSLAHQSVANSVHDLIESHIPH